MPSSIYLSAAHKSSGKTVVSLGLCAALRNKSLNVQPFKKGPDYIDPIWLSQASGRACYNLDFYNMSEAEIQQVFIQQSKNSDISVIEGNKGLYDGMSVSGGDANADLAKLLNVPVILVIDTNGITRGVAPLVQGYQDFDQSVNIAGVILNKVAGPRHESKLISAIEYYTDVPVVGAIRRSKELIIDERHLGLVPANEVAKSQAFIQTASKHVAEQVEIDRLSQLGRYQVESIPLTKAISCNLTVAVAKDSAFGFYYPDDLALFESLGVSLVYFDTLRDKQLPKADALFIGGGFPEMQLEALSSNTGLLQDIRSKVDSGLPTYAECGGLMYLTRGISYQGKTHKMVGAIQADTVMTSKPIGRGYVQLSPTKHHPWSQVNDTIYAHEFHYSKLENIDSKTRFAYKVLRGVGVDNNHDGVLTNNLLATYTHLRSVGGNHWVEQFVNFIKDKQK